MRPGELANWRMAARHLHAALKAGADAFGSRSVDLDANAHHVTRRVNALRDRMAEAGSEAWDDRVSRMALDVAGYVPREGEGRGRYLRNPMLADDPHGDGLPDMRVGFDRDLAALAKAMKLGYAMATRDGSALDARERSYVDGLMRYPSAALARLRPMRDAHTSPTPRAPAPGEPLPFTYVWRRMRPNAFSSQEIVSSIAYAPVREVPAGDAPIVARLATPDEGTLNLRIVDGSFHRPVLEPGGWRPLGLAGIAAAALAGPAWADNPFVPRSREARLYLGVGEYATPGEPRDVGEEMARDAARARALAACGEIIVVDGVPHRRTASPTLYVDATVDSRSPAHVTGLVTLAWRLGDDLRMTDVQNVLGRATGRQRPLEMVGRDPFVSVPLGEMAAMTEFASAWLAEAGRLSAVASRGEPASMPHWSRLAGVPPAEILEPDLLAKDPAAFAKALLDWPAHGLPAGPAEALATHPAMVALAEAVAKVASGEVPSYPEGLVGTVRALSSKADDVFRMALPGVLAAAVVRQAEPDPSADAELAGFDPS